MAGSMHVRGMHGMGGLLGRIDGHCSGRYASYCILVLTAACCDRAFKQLLSMILFRRKSFVDSDRIRSLCQQTQCTKVHSHGG